MKRRTYLRGTASVAGLAALSGCLGGSTPPPRESKVLESLQATADSVQMTIEDRPVVESRADVGSSGSLGALVGSLSPVGVAAAKGRGRGATGRGRGKASSAPKGKGGHAKYHGGDYDDWRQEHGDEVKTYEAKVVTAAVGYIGTDQQMQENAPGPGPIDWDKTWNDPKRGQTLKYSFDRTGWYRSGVELEAVDADHSFGWECVDFEVEQTTDGATIDASWKVSPRL